jgi:hypothetical protein
MFREKHPLLGVAFSPPQHPKLHLKSPSHNGKVSIYNVVSLDGDEDDDE